jgi:hypothetical protein
MKTLQIDVPIFGFQKQTRTREKKITNDVIKAILEKSISKPSKSVCDDFGCHRSTIDLIKRTYVLKNGVLYRRVDDEY